jgi:hypothetical protein
VAELFHRGKLVAAVMILDELFNVLLVASHRNCLSLMKAKRGSL